MRKISGTEISVPYELHSLCRSAGTMLAYGFIFQNVIGEERYEYDWCLSRRVGVWSDR